MGFPDLRPVRAHRFRRTIHAPSLSAPSIVWVVFGLLFCWYLLSTGDEPGLSIEDVVRGLSSRYPHSPVEPWFANPAFTSDPLVYTPKHREKVVKMLFLSDIEGKSARITVSRTPLTNVAEQTALNGVTPSTTRPLVGAAALC